MESHWLRKQRGSSIASGQSKITNKRLHVRPVIDIKNVCGCSYQLKAATSLDPDSSYDTGDHDGSAIAEPKPARAKHSTGHEPVEIPGPDPVPEMMPKQGESSNMPIGMNQNTIAHWSMSGVITL